MQEIFFEETTKSATNTRRGALLRQEGERTPLAPLQACAGWAETVNCHPHPRILLPQNRCLPEPLAAPFPRQPEPRCNTLDFASKVVCAKGMLRPLWKPKRNAHQLRCSSSASALIRLPMALTSGTTSAFPMVK